MISAVFLYFAFRRVDLRELATAFGRANYSHVVPAALLTLISLLFRVVRWKYLLHHIKRIGFASLMASASIGFMANHVLPVRLGELIRAYVIGRKEQISKSSAFATIVLARILDGMTVLLFFVIILLTHSYDYPEWLQKTIFVAFIFFFLAFGFILFLKLRSDMALRAASFLMKPFPRNVDSAVSRLLGSFIDGLGIIKSARNAVMASLFSILVWLPNGVIIYILAKSFDIDLPFSGALLMLAIYTFGIMIPSAPAFIGTIQYFSVIGLSLFGVSRPVALGFSVIYHLCAFLPVTIVGFIFMFIEGYSLMELRKSAGEQENA